ncbi:MAG: DUF2892 domain-containing protein [Chitinophagales bacterium]|nr:DUF2892 domain-containing protein [Chitinophagales bacterium]
MKQNMGKQDKLIRLAVAALIGALYFGHVISGTLAIVLGILAIIFAATSFINFCPIYAALGINTKKKGE